MYTDCIYKVLNPYGKYDIMNLSTGEYYNYSYDSISPIERWLHEDSLIEYEKNGLKGYLNCHGQKMTEAKYTYCFEIRDGYYRVSNEDMDGLLSDDGIFTGELLYSRLEWSELNNGDVSRILKYEKQDRTQGVIYPELNKIIEFPQEPTVFIRLGYDTAILTTYNDNLDENSYFLNSKGIKEDFCNMFGGQYSKAEYTKDGRKISLCTYDYTYDRTTYTNVCENISYVLIDSACKVIYNGLSIVNEGYSYNANFYDKYGYICIRRPTNDYTSKFEYIIIDENGKEISKFISDYSYGYYSQTHEFEYTEKYLLFRENISTKSYLINLGNGNIREYSEGLSLTFDYNYDDSVDDLIINNNQYLLLSDKEKLQIQNVDDDTSYIFENRDGGIKAVYNDGKNKYFIVGDYGTKVLDSKFQKIIDIDFYYINEEKICIIADNKFYNIEGKLLNKESWDDKTYFYQGAYEKLTGIIAKKHVDGRTILREERWAYFNLSGQKITDDEYYYLSPMHAGLGFFAKCDKENYYDYDLDEFGIINGDGEIMLQAPFDNRFLYYFEYSDLMKDVEIGGTGIILRDHNGEYLFYSWGDYKFVSKNKPRPITLIDDETEANDNQNSRNNDADSDDNTGVTPATTEQTTNKEQKVATPANVTITSAKNSKKKSIIIKWKKVKNAKGYEVQYALNKKFTKSKKSKTLSKLTFTAKKLKKGKTYYIRVRAYNLNSSKKKVYGKWSKVKKVKIKK